MAHLATDLAVTLPENRPGMLAELIGAIGRAGINVEGYAEIEGLVHVLTTDAPGTRKALHGAGFKVVQEHPVVLAQVDDRPGSAASVFQKIGDARINLRYSYLATKNRLVIGAENLDAVMTALK